MLRRHGCSLRTWTCSIHGRRLDRLDRGVDRGAGPTPVPTRRCRAATAPSTTSRRKAFSLPLKTLPAEDRRAFVVGNTFFNDNWVTAPASTPGRDGLGPTFNAQLLLGLPLPGRPRRAARPPTTTPERRRCWCACRVPGPDAHGGPRRRPELRRPAPRPRPSTACRAEGQIAISYERACRARSPTARRTRCGARRTTFDELALRAAGRATSMISPRVAPAVFGLGLLEAIPEADDPRRAPTRTTPTATASRAAPNRVWDAVTGARSLGRFGWKANAADASRSRPPAPSSGDIGITSSLLPGRELHRRRRPPARRALERRRRRSSTTTSSDAVTFYTRTLARARAPRRRATPTCGAGEALFGSAGLRGCHPPDAAAPASRPTSPALARPDDPSLHRPAAARHGRRARRRPARLRRRRAASGARRRCGASAWSRPSTATPASCTTAARAT